MSAPLPRKSQEAGVALDKRVAVEVMGLRDADFGPFTTCAYCGGDMRFCGARSWCHQCKEWRHSPYHEYSTEIADAWLVVEKMTDFDTNRDEPCWSVAIFHAQRGQVGCRVYACRPGHNIFDAGGAAILGDNEGVIAEAVGRSAPHAICLAALAALAVPPTPGGRDNA